MSFGVTVAFLALARGALGTGAEAGKALRLQVLLDRAHFSPGEIDGAPGSNTRRALRAYGTAHRLKAGEAAFWRSVRGDHTATLVTYTLTEADIAAASGAEIPEDMMEKARLEALGYTSVIEALAEKFHSSPDLLRRLNPAASWSGAGETVEVPNARTDAPTDTVTEVIVDESDLSVVTVAADDRVLTRYPASMGSPHDPLPLGRWKVTRVQRHPFFFYNPDLFWDADEIHAKARIAPGPNNPVGVVWIDLSVEHYGIHGSPEPSTISKTQSHGCIRLTNWDAAELAALVSPGLPVILRR